MKTSKTMKPTDCALAEERAGSIAKAIDSGDAAAQSEGRRMPPKRRATAKDIVTAEPSWSIGELAKELGVSTRTIRFYEASELIAPQRRNGVRIYSRRDRARMHIILRGKNLGFSLDDIRDYLQLYTDDPSQVSQTQLLLGKVEAAIAGLEHKQIDLERTLKELREIKERAIQFLDGKL